MSYRNGLKVIQMSDLITQKIAYLERQLIRFFFS